MKEVYKKWAYRFKPSQLTQKMKPCDIKPEKE